MNVIAIVITAIVVFGGIIGGMYLLWVFTRPKKMTWKAKVYQLSSGVQPVARDKQGNIISDIRLSELKEYTEDVLERVEKTKGVVVYYLQKLRKVTPSVTADVVENWGKYKQVNILLDGESATLIKIGYDKKVGSKIFRPLPADRINMIKSEIAERTERIKEKKDILQAIMPYVAVGIVMISMVMISYFIGQAWMESAKSLEIAATENKQAQIQVAEIYRDAMQGKVPLKIPDEITKEKPPEVKG